MRAALGPSPGRGLMLGATAELLALAPDILAVDHNRAMLANLAFPRDRALLHDWRALPATLGPFDFVVGDGSFSGLRFPNDYEAVARALEGVAGPRARMVLRLYCAPSRRESDVEVARAALAGRINSFHALKLRLAMALAAQGDSANVAVADLFDRFAALFPDRSALATASGWSLEQIGVIDAYRLSRVHYSFPTFAQLCDVLAPVLTVAASVHGGYELAERCPIVTFMAR